MKKLTCLFVLWLLFPAMVRADQLRQAEPDRPNIVLFYIDDFGWRDTGFNGSKFYLTPNMDRLAEEGMNFTNAYANAPNCAPSRACLMSGMYSPRHGIFTVGNPDRGPAKKRRLIPTPNQTELPGSYQTLPEVIKGAGYATAFLGKWHLGAGEQTGPLGQGFDVNFGGLQWGHPKGYFSPYKNPNLKDGPKGEYLTDRLNEEADRWIRQQVKADTRSQKPFFVCLSHYAVHTPIQAKPDLTKKYKARTPDRGQKNAAYAAMIESVDQGIGKILATLQELKIDKNTIVILYSDNGGMGSVTSNSPLRGAKGMLYEGGIRVPLAMRWPGTIPAKSICKEPVIGTDFLPTFAELAGAELSKSFDGQSLKSLMNGSRKSLNREAIYWHFPAYLQGKQQGAYRDDPSFRTRPAGAIRSGNWKLIQHFEDNSVELFDLDKDLGERNNLAETNTKIRDELLKRLRNWQAKVNAPVPTKRNPKYQPQ